MLSRFRPTVAPVLRARLTQHASRFAAGPCTSRIPCAATRQASTTLDQTTSDKPSAIAQRLPDTNRFHEPPLQHGFAFDGRVYIVTGGAQGLGLTQAETLLQAGGHVYCLDRSPEPGEAFHETQAKLAHQFGRTLHYRKVDVQNEKELNDTFAEIADKHSRLDGLVAAAGVQYVCKAIDYPLEKINEMMSINYAGVYLSAQACATQMIKYKISGSIVMVGSMSGTIANKGLLSSVYNCSKAAVGQLARNMAMEWGKVIDGKSIRVNVLAPGNINTPMVQKNIKDEPHLKKTWEETNMMGRISEPHEYRGIVLYLLSDYASFTTGATFLVDGGATAWR